MSDLQLLLDNKINSIIVDDILSSEQIATFMRAVNTQEEWLRTKVDKLEERLFVDVPRPQYLFLSQYALVYLGYDEDKYLEKCKEYQPIWNDIVAQCGFNIFEILTAYLKKQFAADVEIAAKENKNYWPVTVRDLSSEVLTHADFGPFDGPGWQIDQVVKQLAWNIYLTDPGMGGETIVYDHPWTNNETLDENSYGIKNFDKPIKTTFTVKPGRLVLFNSRNFHEVKPSTKPRVGIGGLIGQTASGKLIAWD